MSATSITVSTNLPSAYQKPQILQKNRAYLLTYSKRQTIPNTAHGNLFHIYQAMYTAFCYALKENLNFEMHLEDQKFGDFDDMILITQNNIIATQYKHHIEQIEQKFYDFITGNKNDKQKLGFSRYFDSLYKEIIEASTLTEYAFCSNNTLPKEIKECLNGENTKFSDLFYEGKTPRLKYLRNLIYSSIFKFSENLLSDFKSISQQFYDSCQNNLEGISHYISQFICDMQQCKRLTNFSQTVSSNKINEFISRIQEEKAEYNRVHDENSIFLWDMLLTDFVLTTHPQLMSTITKFLKQIKFEFNSISLDAVTNEIKDGMVSYFNTNNQVLYYAFFHEFYYNLVSKKSIIITNLSIKSMFEKWRVNYIHIERLFGLSLQRISNDFQQDPSAVEFKRMSEIKEIRELLNVSSLSNFLLVDGVPGIGKSTLISQTIKDMHFREGECLFIDSRQFSAYLKTNQDFRIVVTQFIKLIVIDNAEFILQREIGDLLLPFLFQTTKTKDIKVVLVSRIDQSDQLLSSISQHGIVCNKKLTIKPLAIKDILIHYPFLEKLCLVQNFQVLIQIPFYLTLIIKYYKHLEGQQELQKIQQHRLEDYLIDLIIRKPNFDRLQYFIESRAEQRKSILRRLVYFSSNNAQYKAEDPIETSLIQELIQDGVLKFENNCFAHLLFEEYIVKGIVENLLEDTVESGDTLKLFFETLNRRLNKHQRIYLPHLLYNETFYALAVRHSNRPADAQLDVFFNLIIGALQINDNVFLKQLLLSVRCLANQTPKIIIKSLTHFLNKKIDLKKCSLDFIENLVHIIQIILMQPECFASAAELLLKMLTGELVIPEKTKDRLSEEFPKFFCSAGEMFPMNYGEKMEFLKIHLNDDIFAGQFIWEGLYYAANPSEFGDTNLALESELTIEHPNRGIVFSTKEQNDYSTEALNILLKNLANEDWKQKIEVYILKILEYNIGQTFFSMRDNNHSPQIHDAPLIILKSVTLTQDIIYKVKIFVSNAKKNDGDSMEKFRNGHLSHIPNYSEHSALIRNQLSRINAIIEKTLTATTCLQSLFRRSRDEKRVLDMILDKEHSKLAQNILARRY